MDKLVNQFNTMSTAQLLNDARALNATNDIILALYHELKRRGQNVVLRACGYEDRFIKIIKRK